MTRYPWWLALTGACVEYDVVEYEVVDAFVQDPTDEVDILIVMDNSGSMLGYQLLLGARFHEFIGAFVDADVDYHIGVTTTTVVPAVPNADCPPDELDDIPLPGHLVEGRYITTASEDAEDEFRELVSVGACGSGDERGLEAARIALSDEVRSGPNYGFVREDAALSLVFVSDEQDGSFDPVHDYIADFYDVKGQRRRNAFNASALVVTDTDACIVPQGGSSEGTRYVKVAEETGGVVGNLCNVNFIELVTDLSLNASRLTNTFFLSTAPDLATLRVFVEDEEVPCASGAWTYTLAPDESGVATPAIVFERAHTPRSNERLAARYDRGAGDPADFCPPVTE